MNKQSQLVYQPKEIAEARYSISKDEKRIIMLIAKNSGVASLQKEDGWYDIKISDYAETYDLTKHEAGRDIREAISNLEERWIYMPHPESDSGNDKGLIKYRWISAVAKYPKYGKFAVQFSSEILPFIHNNEVQAEYPVGDIALLQSTNHIRVYNLLKLNKNLGRYDVKLDELKEMFMLENHRSYDRYSEFKRWILNPIVTEINDHTPLDIELEETRVKRKVVSVAFVILDKSEGSPHVNKG